MKTREFDILSTQSTIEWVARKVTGAHYGTIDVKEGKLIMNSAELIGGSIIIDTASIKILDVTDPATNAQFAGHLASADFFSVEKYPEATLEITSVSGTHAEGDLTIKGITNPVGFDPVIHVNGDVLTATARLVVDRTKYGMKFRSGSFFDDLGIALIHDDFELNINITARAAGKD